MKHDAMPTGESHQASPTTLMRIDPQENFDAFLGYVLNDYRTGLDLDQGSCGTDRPSLDDATLLCLPAAPF